ncbi:MAG: 50S ribosomal protein L6 [Halobacteriota archaeon]|nr:50S ribosomal protein L6 [Halobacteriota archaeon]
MPKDIKRLIGIPDGVDVNLNDGLIQVTGPKGKIERRLWHPDIIIETKDSKVLVDAKSTRKRTKAMVGTYASHIQNMVTGVSNGYEYRLKVVYSHFPIQIKISDDKVSIANFLGERKNRYAKIMGDVKVELDGDEVVVYGVNVEDVGQTAANIEQKTKIRRLDPRVFQDGIYIVSKGVRDGF